MPGNERTWSRQLRRDRRATLTALDEGARMPGPGAAQAAAETPGGTGSGTAGRFGNFVRGSALSGMMAGGVGGSAPAAAAGESDAPGEEGSEDGGSGLGGAQMASADDAGPDGKRGARKPSGPVTGEHVKEAMKKAQENAQGGKEKMAAKAAAMATKVLGEDKVAEMTNAVIREFTDPIGRTLYWQPMIWMYATLFLGSIVVIPLHWGYMLLGFVGIPKFNTSVLKSFLFIINNCIFLTIVLILLVVLVGVVKGVTCAHNPLCVIGLIRDYGSYFF